MKEVGRGKIAVFAGSFDPFTRGHFEIVRRASNIFDKVIVAVAEDTGKKTAPIEERVSIACSSISELCQADGVLCQTEARGFSGMTVDFCRNIGASVLIRGLRSAADFEYEMRLASIYRQASGLEVVYFISELAHISSSVVRRVCEEGGVLEGLVADGVMSRIFRLYGNK